MDTPVPDIVRKEKDFWSLRLTTSGKIIALVTARITTVNIKTTVMEKDLTKVNINVKYK
jgi:hypothetical protein